MNPVFDHVVPNIVWVAGVVEPRIRYFNSDGAHQRNTPGFRRSPIGKSCLVVQVRATHENLFARNRVIRTGNVGEGFVGLNHTYQTHRMYEPSKGSSNEDVEKSTGHLNWDGGSTHFTFTLISFE